MIKFDSTLLQEDEVNNRYLTKARAKELLYAQSPTAGGAEKKEFLTKANDLGYRVEGINDTIDNRKNFEFEFNNPAIRTVLMENNKLRDAGIPSNVLNEEQFNYVLGKHAVGFKNKESAFNDLMAELAANDISLDKEAYDNISKAYTGLRTPDGKPASMANVKTWAPEFSDFASAGLKDLLNHPVATLKAMAQNVGSVVGLAESGDARKTLDESKKTQGLLSILPGVAGEMGSANVGSVSGTTTGIGQKETTDATLIAGDIATSFLPTSWLTKGKYLAKVPASLGFITSIFEKGGSIKNGALFLAENMAQTAKSLAITEGDIDITEKWDDYLMGATIGAVAKGFKAGQSPEELMNDMRKKADLAVAGVGDIKTKDLPGLVDASKKLMEVLNKSDAPTIMVSKVDKLIKDAGADVSDLVIERNTPISKLEGVSMSRVKNEMASTLNFLTANISPLASDKNRLVSVIKDGDYQIVDYADYFTDTLNRWKSNEIELVDIQNIRTLLTNRFNAKMFNNAGEVKGTWNATRLDDAVTYFNDVLADAIGSDWKRVNKSVSNLHVMRDKMEEMLGRIETTEGKLVKDEVANLGLPQTISNVANNVVNPKLIIDKMTANDITENTYKKFEKLAGIKLTPDLKSALFELLKNGVLDGTRKFGVSADYVEGQPTEDKTATENNIDKIKGLVSKDNTNPTQ